MEKYEKLISQITVHKGSLLLYQSKKTQIFLKHSFKKIFFEKKIFESRDQIFKIFKISKIFSRTPSSKFGVRVCCLLSSLFTSRSLYITAQDGG